MWTKWFYTFFFLSCFIFGGYGCQYSKQATVVGNSSSTTQVNTQTRSESYYDNTIIVSFKDNVSEDEKQALRDSVNAVVITNTHFELWEITGVSIQEAILMLEEQSEINYAEPNSKVYLIY